MDNNNNNCAIANTIDGDLSFEKIKPAVTPTPTPTLDEQSLLDREHHFPYQSYASFLNSILTKEQKVVYSVNETTGNSELYKAVENNDIELAKLLIHKGASVSFFNPKTGLSCLAAAVRRNFINMVETLLTETVQDEFSNRFSLAMTMSSSTFSAISNATTATTTTIATPDSYRQQIPIITRSPLTGGGGGQRNYNSYEEKSSHIEGVEKLNSRIIAESFVGSLNVMEYSVYCNQNEIYELLVSHGGQHSAKYPLMLFSEKQKLLIISTMNKYHRQISKDLYSCFLNSVDVFLSLQTHASQLNLNALFDQIQSKNVMYHAFLQLRLLTLSNLHSILDRCPSLLDHSHFCNCAIASDAITVDHLAKCNNSTHFYKLFNRFAGDIDQSLDPVYFLGRETPASTLLLHFVAKNKYDFVKSILQISRKSINEVGYIGNEIRATPLVAANSTQMVDLLLENKASYEYKIYDEENHPMLAIIMRKPCLELFVELFVHHVRCGCPFDEKTKIQGCDFGIFISRTAPHYWRRKLPEIFAEILSTQSNSSTYWVVKLDKSTAIVSLLLTSSVSLLTTIVYGVWKMYK